MSHQVLYFPYIAVPQSVWLTQILLYWDQVGSIVPYEYIDHPEALGPYMQQLLREELVVQIQPGAYLRNVPRFAEAFVRYLNSLGSELEVRQRAFAAGRRERIHDEKMGKAGRRGVPRRPIAQIHIEKLDDVSQALEQAGLASTSRYPWIDVERETANDFMCYLATCLGQVPEVDALPITDTGRALDKVLTSGVEKREVDAQVQVLRMQVLEKILPVPMHELEPGDIRQFKDKHGAALGHFRQRVQEELVILADMNNENLKSERMALFVARAREETREIQSWMKDARWKGGAANVGGIVSAVPGAPQFFGLLNAVREAVFGGAPPPPPRDFAYAAHLEARFA
ncbi:MAG TPA: hypothetical protein VEK37_15170 [Gemmatimonadaceae bacterium]|nr:hypothetical protein [Gemmatimonadaceae bacterium]